jgi:hypothetical protein
MTASRYPLAVTRRSHEKARTEGPVGHAGTWTRGSRTGKTYRSVCGRQVGHPLEARFDPDHPRACPACAAEVNRRLKPRDDT